MAGLLLLLAACSSDREPAAPPHAMPVVAADSAQVLASAFLPLSFAGGVDGARAAVPDLVPSGWQRGTRATWLGTRGDARIELETDAGKIVGLTLEWEGQAAAAADRILLDRLPPPADCSPLAGQLSDFRPRVWRLAGQGGATALRRGTHLRLEITDPAPIAVIEAALNCAH
jgi:hypothetical protein